MESVKPIVSNSDPAAELRAEMAELGISPQGTQGGLFRTEKPPTNDLDVIRDWVDENKVKFTTRLKQPFHMAILENVEKELQENFDESALSFVKISDKKAKNGFRYETRFTEVHRSAVICRSMFEIYKIDMIPYEGMRVNEQTEGLRARKDTEKQGAQDPKSIGNFMLGDKGRA